MGKDRLVDDVGRWVNRPKADDMPNKWRILRAKKNGLAPACMLNDDLVGAYVHYWQGRTRLCLHNDCEACAAGQNERWRGYVGVYVFRLKKYGLLEVTPSCINALDEYMQEHASLRGGIITLSRKGGTPNGELECVVERATNLPGTFTSGPDVHSHLCRIWRVTHSPLRSEAKLDAATKAVRNGLVPSSNGNAGPS